MSTHIPGVSVGFQQAFPHQGKMLCEASFEGKIFVVQASVSR